ncbi:MAG: hypothetical protein ACJZ12_01755 [Candidatus Neomarinimicrobiota bacterium]
MNKQIKILLLSCSIFGQDMTPLTNNQTIMLPENSTTHNDIRKLASKIINTSNHDTSLGLIDSPLLITLVGFPTSLIIAESIVPKSWKPEGAAITIFSGFLGTAIWKHKKLNNFNMIGKRDAFLDASSDSDIKISKRSSIFAEELGNHAAYHSIARHKYHMNPLRRLITNYVVTMPTIFILGLIEPISILTYPFVFPRLYDKYNQKTYFNKKKKNYLLSISGHEHNIFSSKHDPIIEEYKNKIKTKMEKQDNITNALNYTVVMAIMTVAFINWLTSISFT